MSSSTSLPRHSFNSVSLPFAFSREEKQNLIKQYTSLMREAAKVLDFEQAAYFRDKITELKEK
ncbi:MAG: hypothetical protein HDT47_08970 [Ruminococcaceae bacterium]|nr:hypothetical protein [Oscillospiraceae bacterium]